MAKFKRYSTGSYGEWIAGKIQINKARKAARLVPFDTDNDPITFSLSDVPKNLVAGDMTVQVSRDKKSITSFRPYNGQFVFKFSAFPAKEGEEPTPKTKKGKGGSEFMTFTPMLEIVEGEFKGILYPYNLYYNFKEDTENLYKGKPSIQIRGRSISRIPRTYWN